MTGGLPERGLVAAAAFFGLAGVALSALSAHAPAAGSLDVAARFLLVHAAALLAIAALLRLLHRRLALAAALAMATGLALFAGDLALRALAGTPLLPLAAPSGGVLLMAGWALLVPAALIGRR